MDFSSEAYHFERFAEFQKTDDGSEESISLYCHIKDVNFETRVEHIRAAYL